MSEMVERMARAAYEKWIEGVESLEPTWAETPQDFRDRLMDSQRAAIRAIREPTEAMIGAGGQAVWEQEDATSRRKPRDADDWPKDNARAAWQAMIDEAMR